MNFGEINLRRAQVLAILVQYSNSKPTQVQDLSLTIRREVRVAAGLGAHRYGGVAIFADLGW